VEWKETKIRDRRFGPRSPDGHCRTTAAVQYRSAPKVAKLGMLAVACSARSPKNSHTWKADTDVRRSYRDYQPQPPLPKALNLAKEHCGTHGYLPAVNVSRNLRADSDRDTCR
jgi:hypothetical protein